MSTDNNNDRYHVTPEDVARFEAAAEQMEPLREMSDEEADRIFGSVAHTVVLHIPHASTVVPAEIRAQILLSDDALDTELLRMTDWYTDELFAPPDDRFLAVRYPVSRLVLDPERFEDDAQEVMAQRGMGVIYTRTSLQTELRTPPSQEEREALLARYYRPHHRALTSACAAVLAERGRVLVIDCHSFASRALPYELDQDPDRPDICLGTDPFHTPDWLVEEARRAFEATGWSVAINRPFAGALVPASYYGSDARVMGLMVEVRRGLYMDEQRGERLASFREVRARQAKVLLELCGLPSEVR